MLFCDKEGAMYLFVGGLTTFLVASQIGEHSDNSHVAFVGSHLALAACLVIGIVMIIRGVDLLRGSRNHAREMAESSVRALAYGSANSRNKKQRQVRECSSPCVDRSGDTKVHE